MQIELQSIYTFNQLGMRDNQEDSRFPDVDAPDPATSIPAFAVCDGVGGCEKGEVASSTVARSIGEQLKNMRHGDEFSITDLSQLLQGAYDALDKASSPANRGMATTLTLVVFHSQGCMAAHIGDSRIYQIRPGEGIVYRSEDHSLVNALVRSGNVPPDQAETHPRGNVITRCMSANDGTRDRDDATVVNLSDIRPGDYFFLASDGVLHCVDDNMLMEILNSEDSDADKMARIADLSRDSIDNNTAALIHIGNVEGAKVAGQPDQSSEPDDDTPTVLDEAERVDTVRIAPDDADDPTAVEVSGSAKAKRGFFSRLFGRKNKD